MADSAHTTPAPTIPPAELRARMAHAVERLLAALDALDAVAEDLEDDNPGGSGIGNGDCDDAEPSLGAPEHTAQAPRGWAMNGPAYIAGANQEHWTDGADGLEADDADLEPMLCAPEQLNQDWAWNRRRGNCEDLEFEANTAADADSEPSLGSIGQNSEHRSQEGWAWGNGLGADLEQNVDDEGHMDTTEEMSPRACFADDEPDLGSTHDINQEVAWADRATGWCATDGEATGTEDDVSIPVPSEAARAALKAKVKETKVQLPKPPGYGRLYGPDEVRYTRDGVRIVSCIHLTGPAV